MFIFGTIHRFLTRFAVAVAVLAICVSFQACTRTDNKPAGPSEKVIFAYTLLPDTALVHIAQKKGYFLQEGLDVTAQIHLTGKAALQSVLEGKADFATVAETPAMFAIMKGEKISIIASINTSQRNMAIIARKDKGILVPHDLKGKKIATTFGTVGEFYMDTLTVTNGVSRKQMTVINLPAEALQDALANGEVDAISAWNPIMIQTQKKLGDRGITFYGEDIYTQMNIVVATQEYIRKNPLNVKKIVSALVKAEEFARQTPAEAQEIAADTIGTDKALISEIWLNNNLNVTLNQQLLLSLEDESRWAIKNGLTKATKVPNYFDYIYFDGLKSVKPEAVRILR